MSGLPKIFTLNPQGINALVEKFFSSFPEKIEDSSTAVNPINFLHSQYLRDLLQNCLAHTEEVVVSKGNEFVVDRPIIPVDLMKVVHAAMFSMVNLQNNEAFQAFKLPSDEELATIDVLSHFNITDKKHEDEVVPLSKLALHNILNNRFFLFREPKEIELVYIDSLTLLAHQVCNKLVQQSKTTGDEHVITSYNIEGRYYVGVLLSELISVFFTSFCSVEIKNWILNHDVYI